MSEWKYWRLDPETTGTHRIGVRSIGMVSLSANDDPTEPEYIAAYVKWDGCMIVDDQRMTPYHLCDIEEEIGRWQELNTLALAYFGGDFCVGGLSEGEVAEYIAVHTAKET